MTQPSTSTRVALVTGGAQGIGRGIVQRLAKEGYAVVVCDINEEQLAETLRTTQSQHELIAIRVNVADEASVAAAFKQVEERFGKLDVLVNSAGLLGMIDNKAPTVEETPLEQWQRVLSVNLTGAFLVCRAAIPLLKRNGGGRIVNVASRAARVRSGNPAYAASKGGLVTFSRYLAGDVAQFGINVNCIAPSRVDTPMTRAISTNDVLASKVAETPLGRIGTVEDMAGTVAFLVSKDASFITGAIIDVNGGSYMQ
ncbi:MAG: SDR family NAD(P)-dependent oxidoreductase [Burkholderiaceae bacterium]|nr:SDR family NAD(P)-dependent oxidoreductase [Burkholderiaceae bacterium]